MNHEIIHTINDIPIREYYYHLNTLYNAAPEQRVLVADIGGTNSNFGVLVINNHQIELCMSLHAPSKKITNYTQFISTLKQHIEASHHITLQRGCIAAAGPLSQRRQHVKPTNLSAVISIPDIQAAAAFTQLYLINDFEAVGLGIDYIDPAKILTIRAGVQQPESQKASIGAGTGLGKVALLWNDAHSQYLPLASEGGHADCSAQTEQEAALFTFMHQENRTTCPISWESVLSGGGLSLIYRFLGTYDSYKATGIAEEIQQTGFKPDRISRYAQQDEQCHDTFTLYTKLYARCAKNFALDVLSLNGMYIAGGIAAHNAQLFMQPSFYKEFVNCGKQQALLENMPLYLIIDYNISLFGAAAYIIFKESHIL
jgi:glucokinase